MNIRMQHSASWSMGYNDYYAGVTKDNYPFSLEMNIRDWLEGWEYARIEWFNSVQ